MYVLAALSCAGSSPTGTSSDDAFRVLFIGNSLTFTHDVPGLLTALAGLENRVVDVRSVAFPNFSLEDHWFRGDALDEIRARRWDVVVMQQGPSTLDANRAHLAEWSLRFAPEIRTAGGVPALYTVWPPSGSAAAFNAVQRSYGEAAEAVDGILLPAGDAWEIAWRRDTSLRLYGPDQFHPSLEGALLAALTIYAVLFETPAAGLPLQQQSNGTPWRAVRSASLPVLAASADAAALTVSR